MGFNILKGLAGLAAAAVMVTGPASAVVVNGQAGLLTYDFLDDDTLSPGETLFVSIEDATPTDGFNAMFADEGVLNVAAVGLAGARRFGVDQVNGFFDLEIDFLDGVGGTSLIGGPVALTNGSGAQTFFGSIAFDLTGLNSISIRVAGSGADPIPDLNFQISEVPVPAAGLLFGTALIGAGFARRRKVRKEVGMPA